MRPPSLRLFHHRVDVYPDAEYLPSGRLNEMALVPGDPVSCRAIVSRASGDEADTPGASEYAATFKVMLAATADPLVRVGQPMTWTDNVGVVRTLHALEESTPRNAGRFVVTAGYHGPDRDGIDAPDPGQADDGDDDPLLGEIPAYAP